MPYHQFVINISGKFKDALIQRMSRLGSLGVVEKNDDIIAYFPDTVEVTKIAEELSLIKAILEEAGHRQGFVYSHDVVQEEDWNESWKKGFIPIDVGGAFTILPPWEEPRTGRINLVIDPGMAFGTGHHETTRSCLVLLEKFSRETSNERFLDLGTGSGILAIAASKIGFKQVVGVDTDPVAIEGAEKNMKLNRADNVQLIAGDIAAAGGKFDVITANLYSGLLIDLAPEIASRMNPRGIAILSGMLREQEEEVIIAVEKARLKVIDKLYDGKWITVVCKRTG